MKGLIWFLCIVVATILNVILGKITGVKMGYFVCYLVVYSVANNLCDKWDKYKTNKQIKSVSHHKPLSNGYDEKNSKNFCRRCGEPLVDNSKFCRKCGTEVFES